MVGSHKRLWVFDSIFRRCMTSSDEGPKMDRNMNLSHNKSRVFIVWIIRPTFRQSDSPSVRQSVRPSVRQSVLPFFHLFLSAHIGADLTGQTHVKFYVENFYEDLLRISSTFSWNRTKLSGTLLYMMTQVGLLLPATLNRHKSPLLESNVMRLLGEPRRYKRYAKALQRYVTRTFLSFYEFKIWLNLHSIHLVDQLYERSFTSRVTSSCGNLEKCWYSHVRSLKW
jgi:hypothetical protein